MTADPFAALPHIPPIDNTFGALLIGTFIGLMYVSRALTVD